ncbi:Polyribonucleotide nucleotidyltransferase 1, mitochondrial [Oopsacas minuta]|uniref:polyribonucleotide nucleotidyltransferase n=1 Tax=Oopsacas minuta TaxID=111878 RepID=A0AAV7KJU6_9METZ|nr:Polyribonucleotide nucleotidyltransferase 1, mitochondrial [Oopsacas minuta]
MNRYLIHLCSPRYFSTLPVVSHKFSLSGKRWEISRGLLAHHADSATLVHFGNTAVLAAIFSETQQNNNTNMSNPFTTDYSEKHHISTDLSQKYFLRSSRHFEKFALISRSIDRTIRPILPPLTSNLNLSCVLLASDGTHDPEIAAINAASAALSLTCTPGMHTCAAVRVGLVNNCWVINPNRFELRNSEANYIVSCTEEGISMIQGSSKELSLSQFCEMLSIAYQHCIEFIKHLDALKAATNPTFQLSVQSPDELLDQTLYSKMKDNYFDCIKSNLSSTLPKLQRGKQSTNITNNLRASALEVIPTLSVSAFEQLRTVLFRAALRENAIVHGVRPGARSSDHIRELSAGLSPLKATHGSAIFQRGETQILSSLSLLPPTFSYDLETGTEIINTLSVDNFCLRYSNPDYAVRDSKSRGMASRRELGHSRLAESAFLTLLPTSFPFSVNLFCDVQSSSGSTSMSSICGASLAILDGGIPLKSVAAGVATGLILGDNYQTDGTHCILSDIQGIEDALGNMDLKVGGTREGITACQLDIKEFNGMSIDLIGRCLDRSWGDRHKILDFMENVISVHRPSLKCNAPVSSVINSKSKTDALTSPGWRYKVRKLEESLGVFIYTLSPSRLYLFGASSEKHSEALRTIHTILEQQAVPELEFGALYRAKVLHVRQYGLMVELYPNQEEPSFVPNSQLHPSGILANSLAFKPDDVIIVKYFGIEPISGRLRISRKAAMCPYEKEPVQLF